MSDDQLSLLLKSAVPEPPTVIEPTALFREARRRRDRRVAVGVVAALVAVVAATAVWAQRPVEPTVAAPTPAASPTSADRPTPAPPTASASDVPRRPCRGIKITNASGANVDYADLFVYNRTRYVQLRHPYLLWHGGTQVTTIRCSIDELTEHGRRWAGTGPWPDRTATFLPRGTVVYRIPATPARCELGVRDGEQLVPYVAVDGHGEPVC